MAIITANIALGSHDGYSQSVGETYVHSGNSVDPGMRSINRYQTGSWWYQPADLSDLYGGTIESVTLTVHSKDDSDGTPDVTFYFDKSASPTAPSTFASLEARTRTTAGTQLTGSLSAGAVTVIDLTAPFAELFAAHPEPTTLHVIADNNKSFDGSNHRYFFSTKDDGSNFAVLTMTYTPAPPPRRLLLGAGT